MDWCSTQWIGVMLYGHADRILLTRKGFNQITVMNKNPEIKYYS